MIIDTHLYPDDVAPAMDWIGELIGAALDKRVGAFKVQERKNPLLVRHFCDAFPLEFALAKARQYRRDTGGRVPMKEEYSHLYGFLAAAYRVHAALPSMAKKPFEGRLQGSMRDANGFRPFAYEISMATHFMQQKWDIEFIDYSGLDCFDLLARKGSVEIEVECKCTSGDAGRKIHRQEVNRLADLLLPIITKLGERAGCHRVLVTIPNRLGKSNDDLSGIVEIVASAIQQQGSSSGHLAKAEYIFDSITTWPRPDRAPDDAKVFFEQRFGITNAHLVFHDRGDFSVIAVMIRSLEADNLTETMASTAKEAADQCTGKRPALLTLHIPDEISQSGLQTLLKTPNGLHAIAHAVFQNKKRQHVDAIAFTVPPSIKPYAPGAMLLSGDLIVLHNPQPLFPCEEARSVFRVQ
jgi:hypothetical protein